MADNKKTNGGKKGKIGLPWWLKEICKAVVAVIIVVIILLLLIRVITRHGQAIEVPSLENLTVEEAQIIAHSRHLRVDVTDSVYIPQLRRGMIFRQNPRSGSYVKKNRRILVTINSLTPKMVSVPDLVGYSLRQAESSLTASQLEVGKLIYVTDIATNNVLGQKLGGNTILPGTQVPVETKIDLLLGLNPGESTTRVPNLISIPYNRVKQELTYGSLNLGKMIFDASVKTYADTLSAVVYKQSPAGGTPANIGSSVTVYMTTDRSLAEKNRKESLSSQINISE